MTKKFMITNSALSNMVYLATNSVANKNYEDTQMKQAFVINANSLGYTYGDDDRPLRVMKAM